uniref:Partial AB-hydrolase lipase domain-containing protein n=1 Tax=Anopheles quadriannulatus TaxID=34691 RepID=A0A182X8C8_ANOQN
MAHGQLALPQQRLLLLLLVFPMLLSAHYYQKHPRRYDSNEYDEDGSVQQVEEDPPFNNLQEEDAYLTVPQLVWKYGYEIEIHEVQTEDGYLLDLYRIAGRRAASGQPPLRPHRNAPIFLMHSLLSSCADWVLMGPGRALAYLLADAGFDVWMGNARGTRYSRKHLHHDPDARAGEFWNFSWHEIGLYDVRALIDHVLNATGAARLHYGGFSQGTMVLFVLLSERPEYSAKLIDMQAISPSVYMYRLEGRIVRTFVTLADPLVAALDAAGRREILPNRRFIAPLVKIVCADGNVTVCRELLYDVAGRNPAQVDDRMLRIFLGHFPAGASLRQLHHFSQIIRTARFAKYSPLRSTGRDGFHASPPAPLYNLTRATVPVVVYYGLNDHVINYRDALQLADEVPNLAAVHQIADRHFTHSDFILAKNSARLLNTILLQEIDQMASDLERSVVTRRSMVAVMSLTLLLSSSLIVLLGVALSVADAASAEVRSENANDIGSFFAIDIGDGALSTSELITKYGYPVESHEATGADGYVTSLTRIPARTQRHPRPLLLVHGLLASSADYVLIGPNNSLAYLLADRDYDVWLADMRGNRYSRRHTRLDSNSHDYWDFTWHEMGYYDLPAVIEYILGQTGASQVDYIGHSQGTTVFFVMASSRPEYNEKIGRMYALSPAVCLRRVRSPPVQWLLQNIDALHELFNALGVHQFLPHLTSQYGLARLLCPMTDPDNLCLQVVSQTVGPNPKMADMVSSSSGSRSFPLMCFSNPNPIHHFQMAMQILVGHDPAGASIKQLFHYAQLQRTGQFRQYDYGRRNNTLRYSHWNAPAYNLSAVTAPVTIFYAQNDWLIDPRDAVDFSKLLPTPPTMHLVEDANFNHLDFTIAINARPMSELIRKYGYPIEQYEITTADGYILTLTRIPPMRTKSDHSLPVLLVHGLFASSADFLIIGPNNSLAYLLADQGHDVWLADLRGNRYCRRHINLPSDSREFWDYTWHEIGYYDLPATIDHVLSVTGARRLHYIGYSQGTTVFFVLASTRPEYNAKIGRMYALSPAVYVQQVRSPIFRWLAENGPAVKCFLDAIGMWQVLPHNRAQYALQRALCPARIARPVCVHLIEQMVGPNPNGTDRLAQHIMAGHNPSGASSKQLLHFAQLNRCGRFQQFAYERTDQNLAHYGREQPPAYNLSAVTAPVALFYALNDWMVGPANVVRLAAELPNVVALTEVQDPHFNHLDFVAAKRIELINKYGYRGQAYTVTTADGYKLGVHRITRKQGPDPDRLPVLLVHGLLGSSADWLVIGPEDALAYQLAKAGYDVWLINTRGNRYSRQHVQLSPSDAAFWNFTWHEKGIYDLPAVIDYMLSDTKHPAGQIYYIGYSEGTTAYFVLTSSRPAYNRKIRLAHALAPSVLLDSVRSPVLNSLVDNAQVIMPLAFTTNLVELLRWSEQQSGMLQTMCPPETKRNPCVVLFDNLFGPNPESLDTNAIQSLVGHCPSGAAVKEVYHYHQVIQNGIFRPYQESAVDRIVVPYNLSASDVPVHIYYGMNDWIIHPKNVRKFTPALPNIRELRAVGGKKFTHLDFIAAKRIRTVLYTKIMANLQNDMVELLRQLEKS